jgi:hypothetical protein
MAAGFLLIFLAWQKREEQGNKKWGNRSILIWSRREKLRRPSANRSILIWSRRKN